MPLPKIDLISLATIKIESLDQFADSIETTASAAAGRAKKPFELSEI